MKNLFWKALAAILVLSMLLTSIPLSALAASCSHRNTSIYEYITDEKYTSLGDKEHERSYFVTSRKLYCADCGKTIETITVNKRYTEIGKHEWLNREWDSSRPDNELRCMDCDQIKIVDYPCKHHVLILGESGNGYCYICDAFLVLNTEQTYCKHKNFTIWQPNREYVYRSYRYNESKHMNSVIIPIYDSKYRFAICDDCGQWLETLNGRIDTVGITDWSFDDYTEKTVFEAHTFENGECIHCGEISRTHADMMLPADLTEIEANAFYGNSSLTEIVIPQSVKSIGSKAFANSGLKYIYLPESITFIADDAFSGTENLRAAGLSNTYAGDWCKKHNIPFDTNQ